MSAFREWYSKAFSGNPCNEIESWCEDAWNAAIKHAESKVTADNTASDAIALLKKCHQALLRNYVEYELAGEIRGFVEQQHTS